MRGIATIDRQPENDTIVIWVTSRTGVEVSNVNAVTIDTANDPNAIDKVRSLTRCCAVLVTDGSVLDGLPIEGKPLSEADIDGLIEATRHHQDQIVGAVIDYRRSARSSSLTLPVFPAPPDREAFRPSEPTPTQHAFTLANYFGKAWQGWLKTDEERRRRTARPKTGETPWIMPDDLNDPALALFPAEFAARLVEQPLG